MFEQAKKKATPQKPAGGGSPIASEDVEIPSVAEAIKNLEGQLEEDKKRAEFIKTINSNMRQNSNERQSGGCCVERGGCCM